MAVLVTFKFDDDPIENEGAFVSTIFSPLLVYGENICCSRASNSKANSPIWPEIQLVRDFTSVLVTCKFEEVDFTSVLVTCKFEEVPIKNEGAIVSTTCSHYRELLVAVEF